MVDDENLDHEYLPILGLEGFRKASAKLILGADSKAIAEGRVGAAQCISGTGAVFTGAQFLSRHYPVKGAACYISNPTWGKFSFSSLFMFNTPMDTSYTLDVVISHFLPLFLLHVQSKHMRTLFFLYFTFSFSLVFCSFLSFSMALCLSLSIYGQWCVCVCVVPLNYVSWLHFN